MALVLSERKPWHRRAGTLDRAIVATSRRPKIISKFQTVDNTKCGKSMSVLTTIDQDKKNHRIYNSAEAYVSHVVLRYCILSSSAVI